MANGDNSELLQAFAMFGKAAQGYGISQQINAANERAQAIKQQLLPEADKRRALTDLAQGAMLNFAAAGADGTQLSAVQMALMPQTPSSVDQALLQGQLNGDSVMFNAAKQIKDDEETRRLQSISEQAKIAANHDFRLAQYTADRQDKTLNAQDTRQNKQIAAQIDLEKLKETNKPPTADQSKAAGFAAALVDAEKNIETISNGGFTGATARQAAQLRTSAWVPEIVGGPTPAARQMRQAKEQFMLAKLRRDSGAAIADHEFDQLDKAYFPQPNDDKATISQKQNARAIELQSFQVQAGPAWNRLQERLPGSGPTPTQAPSDLSTPQTFKPKLPPSKYYTP